MYWKKCSWHSFWVRFQWFSLIFKGHNSDADWHPQSKFWLITGIKGGRIIPVNGISTLHLNNLISSSHTNTFKQWKIHVQIHFNSKNAIYTVLPQNRGALVVVIICRDIVEGFTTSYAISALIMARCTRYNIMW